MVGAFLAVFAVVILFTAASDALRFAEAEEAGFELAILAECSELEERTSARQAFEALILAPVVEEPIFRWIPLMLSAPWQVYWALQAVFALVHFRDGARPTKIAAITAITIALALAAQQSFALSAVIHGAANAATLTIIALLHRIFCRNY